MTSKPTSGDDWDSHWRDSAVAASENPAQIYRHRLILNWLAKTHFETSGARLIDFGCGQGDFLSKTVRKFPNSSLVGFEMSEEGVRVTSEKVPHVKVLQLDLFKPTAEANAFHSWATHGACSEVLEHLDDPGQFIRAMNSYLAPRAYLIITVPTGPMSAWDRRIGHRRHYTVEQMRELVEGNGMILKNIHRAGFPFHNLYRLIVIARGGQLVNDVQQVGGGGGRLARLAMRMFGVLFKANLSDTPWGWQLVAVAQKSG